MSKNSYSTWLPILRLEIAQNEEFEYELEKADIIEVFKRYGKITNVEI
jgi:hypothetical protein